MISKMLEGSLWMRSSLTEINGSWPVLVGLLDSFGVRNISTGTLGALPPMLQVLLESGILTLLQVILMTFVAVQLDSGTDQSVQLQ